MSRKSENMLFFEVGKDESPQEKIASSIKVITLRGHVDENDEALCKILSLNGCQIGLFERSLAEKYDDYGIYYEAQVEVKDDGSGAVDEPQNFEISLKCGREISAQIDSSVNGVNFTLNK